MEDIGQRYYPKLKNGNSDSSNSNRRRWRVGRSDSAPNRAIPATGPTRQNQEEERLRRLLQVPLIIGRGAQAEGRVFEVQCQLRRRRSKIKTWGLKWDFQPSLHRRETAEKGFRGLVFELDADKEQWEVLEWVDETVDWEGDRGKCT